MNDIALRCENLGKRYRIGGQKGYRALRDVLAHVMAGPLRGLRSDSEPHNRCAETEFIWALKNVSLEIKQGEVVGIIGRNGAGKSTLLKILSRVTRPTEGCAEIYGRVGSLLEVGTGFHPELTGRENVYLNGAILGMKKREMEARFDEIVAFAGVEKFLETAVKYYSSGMHVRLAFAVAAHLRPEILLIDEVLAVGDIEFQKKCIGRMEKVAKEGRTVVVVSHSMPTVKALCSRAVLIEGGMVKTLGPVDSVLANYLGVNGADLPEKILTEEDHDPGGGNKIRLRQIRLLKGLEGSFSVYWRQPISVALDVEVFERITDVSFGACIRTLDGSFIFVVYCDDEGRPPWDLEAGTFTIEATLQNALSPGFYKLHIGAHQGNARLKNLFSIDAVTVEILGFGECGSIAPPLNPGLVCGVHSAFSYIKTQNIRIRAAVFHQ